MAKRKRDDADGESDAEERATAKLSVRQKRVRFKIDGGAKTLSKAFKLAMGFERQKMGRRMKKAQAENNQKDIDRINEEIKATKALDPLRAAQMYLFKSLMRIKAVAQHPNLPDEIRTPGVLATDTPTLNVNARLCNSNPVQNGLPQVLKDIQLSLGLDLEEGEGGKRKRVRAKDLQVKEDVPAVKQKGAEKGRKRAIDNADVDEQSEADGIENDIGRRKLASPSLRHKQDDEAADGISEGEDDLAQYDDRLAASDDDSQETDMDDDEDDDIAALESRLASEGVKRSNPKPSTSSSSKAKPSTQYSLEDDLSISSAEEEDDGDSDSDGPREPRKAASSSTAAAPITTKSSFLPSLTLGGYLSGSGSDMEGDAESSQTLRKNRRGQRARQAIWEKKFGRGANHLQNGGKKDKERNGKGRNQGWDAKRGATDGTRNYRGGGGGGGHRDNRGGDDMRGGSRQVGGNKLPPKRSRDDSGPIHPSWEAAKKAKERKEAPVAFAGKKTTFD